MAFYKEQTQYGPSSDQTLKTWFTNLWQEVDIDDIRRIRDYFGIHDKTPFEHYAYEVMDRLYKKLKNKA